MAMKNADKNIFICLITILLGSCGGYLSDNRTHWSVNPSEMHSWQPPDEAALSARKSNQLWLDDLTAEIEVLFVNHSSLTGQELALFEAMLQVDPKTQEMDSSYTQIIEAERKRKKRMEKDVELSKTGFLNAEAKFKELMTIKPPILFSVSDYNFAMKNFSKGKFKKSLELFFKLNKQKPPLFLQDNIQFGIGSAYYRLKNYPKAKSYFHKVLKNHPKGDKNFISYFMLGVIHNLQGEKSRAILLLEEALGKNPPNKMRNNIYRLIDIVNDESVHVAG
jgi:tetratricopeptide (TPR) repeat protein